MSTDDHNDGTPAEGIDPSRAAFWEMMAESRRLAAETRRLTDLAMSNLDRMDRERVGLAPGPVMRAGWSPFGEGRA